MKPKSPDRAGTRDSKGAPTSPSAKLKRELSAFQRLRPKLLESRLGQFVAIHRGQVIDSDADEFRLAARIEDTARREGPVAICKVTDASAQPADYPYAHFESPAVAEPDL